ncbi:5163_t:CDS:2, partial [Diversispora eburnea]
KDDPLAQFNVGWCHKNGRGIAKDETKGSQYLMKSAFVGNIDSICEIGYNYVNGMGVGIDVKAFEWYKKAAESENYDTDSKYYLGKCFYEGYGLGKI